MISSIKTGVTMYYKPADNISFGVFFDSSNHLGPYVLRLRVDRLFNDAIANFHNELRAEEAMSLIAPLSEWKTA